MDYETNKLACNGRYLCFLWGHKLPFNQCAVLDVLHRQHHGTVLANEVRSLHGEQPIESLIRLSVNNALPQPWMPLHARWNQCETATQCTSASQYAAQTEVIQQLLQNTPHHSMRMFSALNLHRPPMDIPPMRSSVESSFRHLG
jgi:hypothetical protein